MSGSAKGGEKGAVRLIVNADDFGLSAEVNRGVALAHSQGILTSATLLANAPSFGEAVGIARENPGLGVGVHLNLVRGRPLSPVGEVPLLVGGGGEFRRFRAARLTGEFLSQAEREYRRQLERVVGEGIRPTHVDFEKHHAWQGPLYLLACRLAGEFGIGAVRNLREPVAWTGRALGWPGVMGVVRASLLRSGFDLGGGGGGRCVLARPDRLLGQAHIGGMTEEVWVRLAGSLPGGVSEVMTHPGTDTDVAEPMGDSWLRGRRKMELDALLSRRVRELLELRGVRLVHFGDL